MRTIVRPSICTYSSEMLGDNALTLGGSSNSAWPAANDALFVPVVLTRPALVKRLFCVNGNVTSGNVDMGIYTNDGARVVSIGSTAQGSASVRQFFDIADTYLSPGNYYLAAAMNNNTGVIRRFNQAVIAQQRFGVVKMATAFALPAAATFATVTGAHIPLIGMELMGIV